MENAGSDNAGNANAIGHLTTQRTDDTWNEQGKERQHKEWTTRGNEQGKERQ